VSSNTTANSSETPLMGNQDTIGVTVQLTTENANISEVIREKKIKLREFCLFYLVFSVFSSLSAVNCYRFRNVAKGAEETW